MFFQNLECNLKILTVQKLSWSNYDSHTGPRKYHALAFRVKGNAHIECSGKKYDIYNKDTLFIPHHLGYHITAKDEELYVIHFTCPINGHEEIIHFCTETPTHVQQLFAKCYDVWTKKKNGYYFRTLSIFFNIIAQLDIVSDISPSNDYPQLKPAIEYLHKHYMDTDISVETLCNRASMSDTWFRKCFLQVYGTTPSKYINQLRIKQACEMIDTGYFSVEQISESVGFSDSKYFSTVFRKHTGYSPSEYKRKGLNNP